MERVEGREGKAGRGAREREARMVETGKQTLETLRSLSFPLLSAKPLFPPLLAAVTPPLSIDAPFNRVPDKVDGEKRGRREERGEVWFQTEDFQTLSLAPTSEADSVG